MTLIQHHLITQARVNWSRWIADCPNPFCTSALAVLRNQPWFICLDCGCAADIQWPNYPEDIERVLIIRPDPTKRNWFPGETLLDLWWENIQHGVYPDPSPFLTGEKPGFITLGRERILASERYELPRPAVMRALES